MYPAKQFCACFHEACPDCNQKHLYSFVFMNITDFPVMNLISTLIEAGLWLIITMIS